MQNRPIMPKTSDLPGNKNRPNWVSPAHLARFQDCDERTVREWCKKGLIPEAYQTPGGHWRIAMPLSWKTRAFLDRRSSDWPFKKNARDRRSSDLGFKGAKDFHGDWAPDFAEWLMLAQLYQRYLGEDLPVPTIAELGDPVWEGIEQSTDPRAKIARRIQNEIIQRLENGKSFSDLLLKGWVYQFWRRYKRRPTVAEIAEFMGLSVGAFYRRYTRAEMYKALRTACGRVAPRLPDPKGLDSVQRANIRAKKKLRFRSA
jgi:hypothetical protein